MVKEDTLADRVSILALGAACTVPALPFLWKATSLRKEMFDRWAVRVDIVSAGLSERAARNLRQLQVATDRLLGDSTKGFNPDLAVSDPGALQRLTSEFDRLLGARHRIRGRLNLVLRLCVLAPCLLAGYLAGAILALGFYAGLYDLRWLGWTGLGLSATAIAAGTVVTALYWYVNSKLTSAEVMAYIPSDSASPGDSDG